MCLEIAVYSSLVAVGTILMGHFEEGTPKWKRVAKFFFFMGVIALITATGGRLWLFVFLGVMLTFILIVHLWWLPRHGINGWTGEPKDKYYELRGWRR